MIRGLGPADDPSCVQEGHAVFLRSTARTRGLMSWTVRDTHGQARWLEKFEALRAVGFGAHMTLPAAETDGYEAVGNSISPMHAARVRACAEGFTQAQCGGSADGNFANIFKTLLDRQLSMQEAVLKDSEVGYQILAFRLLHPGFKIALCGQDTSMPLVQACRVCSTVACTACVTTECRASHNKLRDDGLSDTSVHVDGSQFMITEVPR